MFKKYDKNVKWLDGTFDCNVLYTYGFVRHPIHTASKCNLLLLGTLRTSDFLFAPLLILRREDCNIYNIFQPFIKYKRLLIRKTILQNII